MRATVPGDAANKWEFVSGDTDRMVVSGGWLYRTWSGGKPDSTMFVPGDAWGGWLPTSANINTLPPPLRAYVQGIETLCDPAGIVAHNTLLQDHVRQLTETLIAATKEGGESPAEPARDARAVDFAIRFGGIDGEHHKTWVIDQMVRVLTGDRYNEIVAEACDGEDGPETYGWDTGVAP